MLLFPGDVFQGARNGLLLWFETVLPTLLPFLIIVNIMLRTSLIRHISRLVYPVLGPLFSVSPGGCFAVLTGFLCGYPMGAKVTADLVRDRRISSREGAYLLSFCNNTSPVFILNFIVWKTLGREEYLLPSLLILLGTPMLMSIPFRRFYLHGQKNFPAMKKTGQSKTDWGFRIVDTCIMDSFETITKVGGYIILFSVILALVQSAPWQPAPVQMILPALEVTNGIALIGKSTLPFTIQYPAILALTSFGGICAAAQTQCMIQKTSLSVVPYTLEKLATAGVASLIAVLYLQII